VRRLRRVWVPVALALVMSAWPGCVCGVTHSAPDAAADAVSPSEIDIDVLGRWHDCANTLTFEPDGSALRLEHRTGCLTTGTFDVSGRTLEIAWEASACAEATRWTRELVRTERGFVAVDPSTGTTSRLADDATPREHLELVGDGGERTIVRVVGTPGMGLGSGCYWSADGTCGGLFSCGGSLALWSYEGEMLSASAQCGGSCACGARLTGMRDASGVITGTYSGANCERVLSGTFVATPVAEE